MAKPIPEFETVEDIIHTEGGIFDFMQAKLTSAVALGKYEITHRQDGSLVISTIMENPVESNFEFYADGFTLKGTRTVGEIKVAHPDGRTMILKTAVLTAFLDRRFSE